MPLSLNVSSSLATTARNFSDSLPPYWLPDDVYSSALKNMETVPTVVNYSGLGETDAAPIETQTLAHNFFDLSNLTTSEQTSPFSSQYDSMQWSQQAVATEPLFIGENNNDFANLTLPHW